MEISGRIEDTTRIVRKASDTDVLSIWNILQQGIEKRRNEGSDQWQDGYPNREIVAGDIANGWAYIVENDKGEALGYFALIFEKEPAYEDIEGKWLSDFPYAVIHRMATDQKKKVKGLATWILLAIEKIVRTNGRKSIKVDTNFDNGAMLYLFEKLGYHYCGEVYFRGKARRAFEKILL